MYSFAVIFDFDGVILDSSRHHELSWERLAAERELPLPPDHFHRGFGMKNEKIIPELLQWSEDPELIRTLSYRKEELYREIMHAEGAVALPGVKELLTQLQAQQIPYAIGSSTHRANLECGLEVVGLRTLFDIMISGEDVTNGKPDPEVFLKAAAALEVAPARCVVLEDAVFGIKAAHAAGMKAVGVATTHSKETVAEADLVVSNLEACSVEKLTDLFESCTQAV